jgi:hypothetical protein
MQSCEELQGRVEALEARVEAVARDIAAQHAQMMQMLGLEIVQRNGQVIVQMTREPMGILGQMAERLGKLRRQIQAPLIVGADGRPMVRA